MAEGKKYILDGYCFNDSDSYEQARRELNRIAEIKAEKNLKDEVELREAYDSLVESGEFNTPIGIGFLREAQKRLVKNPEQRKTMKAIPYYANEMTEEVDIAKKVDINAVDDEGENVEDGISKVEETLHLINNFNLKLRNYRIIIAFMAVMILIPFGVLLYDRVFASDAAKEAIVNEYASWKEELTKKEQELNERERIFEGMADEELNSGIKTGGE